MQATLLHNTHCCCPDAAAALRGIKKGLDRGTGAGRQYLDECWIKARRLQGWVVEVATPSEALQGRKHRHNT